MQRPWRNTVYFLFSMACSANFLIEPRPTCPGVAPPTISWVLPHQPPNKTKYALQACSWAKCSHRGHENTLLDDPGLGQADKKQPGQKQNCSVHLEDYISRLSQIPEPVPAVECYRTGLSLTSPPCSFPSLHCLLTPCNC